MRPTQAIINLTNLKANYLSIRKKTKTKVLAVVKADAYGHGVFEIVAALNSLTRKPEYFGVAIAEEGIQLRKLKIKQPILLFESPSKHNINAILQNKLTPSLFSLSDLKFLESSVKIFTKKNGLKSDVKVKVHIKINTGMGRVGIHYSEAVPLIKKVVDSKYLHLDGIYSHFATSDEKDKRYANLQLKRFNGILEILQKENIPPGIIHMANSGAILSMRDAYFDMVRPGISLYGYTPSLEVTKTIPLKPVLELVSEVSTCTWFDKGESVSYGRLYSLKKRAQIVSVPVGYADGINRNLSNKMSAIINGKVYPQVGRVTMDRIMFNVGSDNIKVGDKVILLGSQKNNKIDAWDWSKKLNTIPYEITCNISKRVPRVYK